LPATARAWLNANYMNAEKRFCVVSFCDSFDELNAHGCEVSCHE
jgi:hypothetical protein